MKQHLSTTLLLIENIEQPNPEWLHLLLKTYNFDTWININCTSDIVNIVDQTNAELFNIPSINGSTIVPFLQDCFRKNSLVKTILRIRNPDFPLPSKYLDEIYQYFSDDDYDYVLSTADECGLAGFFIERLNRDSLKLISETDIPVMPPGYLNGMATPKSGRHWLSLELQ